MKEQELPNCPSCDKNINVEYMGGCAYYCDTIGCPDTWFVPGAQTPEPENQMYQSMKATFSKCLAICAKKGHDYAGVSDPYKNFETVKRIGVTVQQGIFIRTLDKITRLENLLTTAPYVTEETFEDTIDDAINYLAILKARREMERN